MSSLPVSKIVGATVDLPSRVGFYIPGGNSLGGKNEIASINLSDIDTTTLNQDTRLLYSCVSPRAYNAADGTIQFAVRNEWPLEFRNGVAIGRHPPEPQRTNYKAGARAPSATLYRLSKSGNMILSPAGEMESIEYVTVLAGTTSSPTLFSDVMLSGSCPLTVSVIGKNATAEMTVRKESTTTSRGFVFDEFTRSVLVSDYDALAARNRYSIYFPKTDGAIGYIWHIQIEEGEFATSPILTTSVAATRAAAFASVRIWPGLSGIRVHYSDESIETITLTGDEGDYCPLPQSTQDWGTRYIQRISYWKE